MAGSTNATHGRRLTLDDIFAVEQVCDAQISPDGAYVAYTLTRDYAETPDDAPSPTRTPEASVWLADATGATPARRFTFGPHSDYHARWSPDGKTLAFLSDREKRDVHQLYVMSASGGEARRLTNAKGGVTDLAWSPDGKRIAFLAPDAESDEEEKRKREQGGAQVLNQDYKFTRLWVVDVAEPVEGAQAEAHAITPPEYQVRGFAWYRDGWAVVSSPTPEEDDFILPWTLLAVTEGNPAQTLWKGKYPIAPLAASMDGKSLAWLHGGASVDETSDEVWVITEADAEPRCVTRDYGGGTAWVGWTPDGKSLLLGALDGARSLVGQLDLASGTVETLIRGRTLAASFTNMGDAYVTMSRDGKRIACAPESGNAPREVWAGETGSELKQVTHHNAHLRNVALGRQETVHWTAPDGLEIEGVLVYPAGYEEGKRYPLIVQAHGGPNGRWSDHLLASWHDWAQWLAAHGYVVLLPNPRGSVGYGREFTWRNRRAWGEGDFADFTSGVDALIERGLADPDRMGFGGWSYGGYMTSWAIGHSDRFKAAIVGAGVTDLLSFQAADIPTWLPTQQMFAAPYEDSEIYTRLSPITSVGKVTTPTLIVHGAADERVRVGQGRELYHALRARNIPTEMVVYPDEGHIFSDKRRQRDLLARIVAWYDRWLKPSEAQG